MLNDASYLGHVYIAVGYTDLRKGIDTLALIIKNEFQLDPYEEGKGGQLKNKTLTPEELNHMPKNALVQMYLSQSNSLNVIRTQLELLQKQNQSTLVTI